MTDPTKQLQQLKREIHDRLIHYGNIAAITNAADLTTKLIAKLQLLEHNPDWQLPMRQSASR